ncbi:hypothetical protein PoB_001348200 [Plakobranchus ocellatus]|uniref:Uncharacterized protein n=1 Tax=Plakobranchus ocellatus TaxID=259542 RepID=A0AAV3YXR0_9GAST|nr:hypothetical protein PoB_001348200 [Plakobranchus ocellatus]
MDKDVRASCRRPQTYRPLEVLHGEVEGVLPGVLYGQLGEQGKLHGVVAQYRRGVVGERAPRVWVGGYVRLVVRQAHLEVRMARFRADAVLSEAVAAGAVRCEAQVVAERADLELEHARGLGLPAQGNQRCPGV